MKKEQQLRMKTQVKFDLIDRIKILFGAIPEVEVIINVPIKNGEEIEMYNYVSTLKLIRKTKSNFIHNKNTYGHITEGKF